MTKAEAQETVLEMNREAKTVFLCMREVEKLRELGIIEGGILSFGRNAEIVMEVLKEEGFKPTDEETERAMEAILSYDAFS